MGELDEVLRPAGRVGADVEQQHRSVARPRHRQCERGAVDAAVALDVVNAGDQRRAGRTAGDERLRPSVGDCLGRLDDRGVRASSGRRTAGSGALAIEIGASITSTPVGGLADLRCVGEQQHLDPAGGGERGAGGDLGGTEIGPVPVNGNRHHAA